MPPRQSEPVVDRVAAAVAIAAEVHAGQVDRGGYPYILHPLYVMAKVAPQASTHHLHARDTLLCAAVLHDAIEDAPTSGRRALEQRIYDACGDRCHAAVLCLTHRDHESYDDYITRICGDWIARRVKVADLEHNMDGTRLPAGSRVPAKYAEAWSRISQVEAREA